MNQTIMTLTEKQ
jgi:hypothetical protein